MVQKQNASRPQSPLPVFYRLFLQARNNKITSCLFKGWIRVVQTVLTFSQTTTFRRFQTDRVCRQQFSFDEDGRGVSKRVENTVEQERQIVARYARLTPSCKAGACTG